MTVNFMKRYEFIRLFLYCFSNHVSYYVISLNIPGGVTADFHYLRAKIVIPFKIIRCTHKSLLEKSGLDLRDQLPLHFCTCLNFWVFQQYPHQTFISNVILSRMSKFDLTQTQRWMFVLILLSRESKNGLERNLRSLSAMTSGKISRSRVFLVINWKERPRKNYVMSVHKNGHLTFKLSWSREVSWLG